MQYPQRLRDKGIEGHVTMSVLVNATGGVERVKIIESKPPGVFDDVAQQAIRGWRFQPGTYEGEAVKVWVRQTFRFELKR
jgi:protein TonB